MTCGSPPVMRLPPIMPRATRESVVDLRYAVAASYGVRRRGSIRLRLKPEMVWEFRSLPQHSYPEITYLQCVASH
jgi:hypothetical protein